MPVATFHFSGGDLDQAVSADFLRRVSTVFAEELESPVDRIRAFLIPHGEALSAVKGEVPGERSVFFEFFVLEGRALEQRQRIARAFTELIAQYLGVDASSVRGRCIQVPPEDWCIGGQFASELRKSEIAQRKTLS